MDQTQIRASEAAAGQAIDFIGNRNSADLRRQAEVAQRSACNQCPESGACIGAQDAPMNSLEDIARTLKSATDVNQGLNKKLLKGLAKGAGN